MAFGVNKTKLGLPSVGGGGGGGGIVSINKDTTAAQSLINGSNISITDNGGGSHTFDFVINTTNLGTLQTALSTKKATVGWTMITDVADLGILVFVTSTSNYNPNGMCGGFLNADWRDDANADYSGVKAVTGIAAGAQLGLWASKGFAANLGEICIWWNGGDANSGRYQHYQNITGTSTTTAPNIDTTNWAALPLATNTGYVTSWDAVGLDILNSLLINQLILFRNDKYGNLIGNYRTNSSPSINAVYKFPFGYYYSSKDNYGWSNNIFNQYSSDIVLQGRNSTCVNFESQAGGNVQFLDSGNYIYGAYLDFYSTLIISGNNSGIEEVNIINGHTLETNGFFAYNVTIDGLDVSMIADLLDCQITIGASSATLQIDASAITTLGQITLPANSEYIGTFIITTGTGADITKITNTNGNFPVTFRCANGVTQSFLPTAVGSAVQDNIVSPSGAVAFVIDGSHKDRFIFQYQDGFNTSMLQLVNA